MTKQLCIISQNYSYPALENILFILKNIYGKKVYLLKSPNKKSANKNILNLFLIFFYDLRISINFVLAYKKCHFKTVFIFQSYFPFLLIILKILRVKSILYIGGSAHKSSYYEEKNKLLLYLNLLLEYFCYNFIDLIILPSETMLKWTNLEKHNEKIHYAIGTINSSFFKTFDISIPYSSRSNIIGFVGNIIKGKGIINLINSIEHSKKYYYDNNIRIMIIGKGKYLNNIKIYLQEKTLNELINILGYVPNSLLPKQYNKMKLLILPSYTEGLPSVIIESMACGTPVLTTFVGAIPDIIKDNETGFLLKCNDPKHIAERITELLDKPELLDKVSINAYRYVRDNFSYEKTFKSWQNIFDDPKLI